VPTFPVNDDVIGRVREDVTSIYENVMKDNNDLRMQRNQMFFRVHFVITGFQEFVIGVIFFW